MYTYVARRRVVEVAGEAVQVSLDLIRDDQIVDVQEGDELFTVTTRSPMFGEDS